MSRPKEYKLPETLTIQQVSDLKKDLLLLLETSQAPWRIDWCGCRKVDLAGMQVLIAFVREAVRLGGAVRFFGPIDPNLSQELELANFLTQKGGGVVFFDQLAEGGIVCESR